MLSSAGRGTAETCDLQELSIACTFSELLAEKLMYVQPMNALRSRSEKAHVAVEKQSLPPSTDAGANPPTWTERVTDATRAYVACWHVRNKPSGIEDIRRTLRAVAEDLRVGLSS
jgi:hypothetical protein